MSLENQNAIFKKIDYFEVIGDSEKKLEAHLVAPLISWTE